VVTAVVRNRICGGGHLVAIDHASDHGATVSVYLEELDGNGVELYYDRPRADRFVRSSRPAGSTRATF
jgi:catechol 2,3-dioxygenase